VASLKQQIAALPYRVGPGGGTQVMLVTSRETRRWVVPKGNPIRGLSAHRAAEQEAWEEAGVSGIMCPVPIGSFRYRKRTRLGRQQDMLVTLFPLAARYDAEDWPERVERERRWFDLPAAAAVVDEPELRQIISEFRQPPRPASWAGQIVPTIREHAKGVPMLGWFQSLMPKQGRFFELFEAHATTLVAGADALARLLDGGADMPTHIAEVVRREHEADDVTRDVLQDVRRVFVTPFDRSAITDLIGVMDDSIDQMNQTAKTIELYEVTSFAAPMRDMAGIVVEAARVTAEAIPLLRSLAANAPRLHELTGRLIELEGQADDIHDRGLRELFKSGTDPMRFIVSREIYSHLERIVDRFEDVANEIQGLVIDHA
jgi:uncharacterized protein Yka (UPF0111/DUF47 family)/8-oxo-dGTP pyrophosphatase MutT (NUDIX family)